jgi:2-methylcitrate dehydratase PrpD
MADGTAALASYVGGQRDRELPEHAARAARNLVLDAVGCALAGAAASHVKAGYRAITRLSDLTADATVIGHEGGRPADVAAFANTLAARAHLYDDTYGPGHLHAGAALTFTAMALGQAQDATVGEFLHSVAVGAEVAARVGAAAGYEQYARGFHNTGTCVVFGTAAAAASLLGLDSKQVHAALSMAGEYASGLRQYQVDGDAAESALHAANAARNGIMATYLAIEGFPAADEILEGRMGFLACFGSAPGAAALLTDGLGSSWAVEQMSIKPFPSCRGTHGAGTAALDLRDLPELTPESIEAIRVYVPENEFVLCNRPQPTTPLDAQFSIQYVVAHVLAHGSLTVSDFADSHLRDPAVQGLAGKVTVIAAPDLHGTACRVLIYLDDGTVHTQEVVASRGDPENPFQPSQLDAKFVENASGVLPVPAAQELLSFIRTASGQTPLSAIGLLLAAGRHGAAGDRLDWAV